MNIKEANGIIEEYAMWEDESCTCHMGNPPCSKCEKCPSEDVYNEALLFVKDKENKAEKLLKEFLESELEEYSFNYEIELDDVEEDEYFFEVTYYMYDYQKDNTIMIKVDMENESIHINMYEDTYEEIRTYDWRVKYFWMNIKWEI